MAFCKWGVDRSLTGLLTPKHSMLLEQFPAGHFRGVGMRYGSRACFGSCEHFTWKIETRVLICAKNHVYKCFSLPQILGQKLCSAVSFPIAGWVQFHTAISGHGGPVIARSYRKKANVISFENRLHTQPLLDTFGLMNRQLISESCPTAALTILVLLVQLQPVPVRGQPVAKVGQTEAHHGTCQRTKHRRRG